MNSLPNGSPRWFREAGAPDRAGFTRVDLLVLLVMLGLLAGVGIGAVSDSSHGSHRVQCASNLRQLANAWLLFAAEADGKFAPNVDGSNAGKSPGTASWVGGWLDFSQNLDNIETRLLVDPDYLYAGKLGPFLLREPRFFRCPSDQSLMTFGGWDYARVRSYSMNSWVGASRKWSPTSQYSLLNKLGQVREPARTWVIMDEREDSINDGLFWVDMDNLKGTHAIVDYPASYHVGGANLSFADGHVELWRWRDPRTVPFLTPSQLLPLNVASPNNPDMARLQAASTYRP